MTSFSKTSSTKAPSLTDTSTPAQNRKADYVLFHEIVETSNKTFVRDITKIEKSWLLEYARGYYQIRGG